MRLELVEVNGVQYVVKLFQFHKGAIRTAGIIAGAGSLIRFQFHKGAIRTYRCVPVLDFAHKFQFHKGAIRTGCS